MTARATSTSASSRATVSSAVSEARVRTPMRKRGRQKTSRRSSGATFYARVHKGRLEPLDPSGLHEGAVVIVQATPAVVVPRYPGPAADTIDTPGVRHTGRHEP